MDQKEIAIGGEYALRDPPRVGEPLQHVRVAERARTKWKVEWIDPNPGLTDFVKSNNLVVDWQHRQGFLRDERRLQRLRSRCRSTWPGPDHPLDDAIGTILESSGEPGTWIDNHGVLSGLPDAIERLAQRTT